MAHVLPVPDETQDASTWGTTIAAAVITTIKTSPVQIAFYLCQTQMRTLLAKLDRRAAPPPDEWPDWLGLWAFVTTATNFKALHYGASHFPRWLRVALFRSIVEHAVFVPFFGPERPLYDPLYGAARVRWEMLQCAITPALTALSIVYFCPDFPHTAFDWLVLLAYASQSVGWLYFFLEMWPDLRDRIFPARRHTVRKPGERPIAVF